MDADVAGELQALRDMVTAAQGVQNNWRQNGLETLTNQRAFTFGSGKVRVDRLGVQTTLPAFGSPDQYWYHSTAIPANDYSTQFPRIDGLTGQGSGTGYYELQAFGPSAADEAVLFLTGAAAGSTAQLQAYTGSVQVAKVSAEAPSGGYVNVNPRLFLTSLAADPGTPLDGSLWYQSTVNRFRVRQNGVTANLVLSTTTVDDLTQYLLLAGRSGGQVAIGGTATGNPLTLVSNSSHDGKVVLGNAALSYYNESTDVIRIGASGKEVRLGEVMSAAGVSGVSLDYASAHAGQATVTALNPGTAWLTLNLDCNSLVVNPGGLTSKFVVSNTGDVTIAGSSVTPLLVSAAGTQMLKVDANANAITIGKASTDIVLGAGALLTTATDGFLYIPTCAGTPTGVPTAFTGRVPLIFDTTGAQLWIYTGGVWKQPKVLGAATVVDWQ